MKSEIKFVVHANYREYFEEMLNANQVKRLMILIFDFLESEEYETDIDDLLLKTIYKTMIDNINIGSKRQITSKENGEKGGRPNIYGELQNVKLTKYYYNKYCEKYGEDVVLKYIDILSKYKEQSGKVYNNDAMILEKFIESNEFVKPTWDVKEAKNWDDEKTNKLLDELNLEEEKK